MWSYRRLLVGNTFAYRCTDQKRLLEADNPVGPANDAHILKMACEADKIIMAYGKPNIPHLRTRGKQVTEMLLHNGFDLFALKILKDGTPGHPLYIRNDFVPVPFMGEVG
jgi:hypothetical protein